MALGDFRCRLRDSVEILATHKGDVKTRLYLAINNRLVFANLPEAPELPEQFREELDAILSAKASSITLHGRNHGLDYCHDPLAHVAVYVEWKIKPRSGATVKLDKRHHALASCDRAPETC
ncbi:hypothetical protein [Pseudomonas syringae]|uniref:hypothetical protein n=1 Tax=Pseudomonas syringae TaxID=317 RepID=UPI0016515B54|nr:hypothetical protein [Pseudomonas syringae]